MQQQLMQSIKDRVNNFNINSISEGISALLDGVNNLIGIFRRSNTKIRRKNDNLGIVVIVICFLFLVFIFRSKYKIYGVQEYLQSHETVHYLDDSTVFPYDGLWISSKQAQIGSLDL